MADCPCPHTNVTFIRKEELAYNAEYDAETETVRVDLEHEAEFIEILDEQLYCEDCGEYLHYTDVTE